MIALMQHLCNDDCNELMFGSYDLRVSFCSKSCNATRRLTVDLRATGRRGANAAATARRVRKTNERIEDRWIDDEFCLCFNLVNADELSPFPIGFEDTDW